MSESLLEKVGPRLRAFLDPLLLEGDFRLTYSLRNPPPEPEEEESPALVVDFDGPDAALLLANDGELLRSLEHLTLEALRVHAEEAHGIAFDCQNRRRLRRQELRSLAELAAQRVAKSGLPYAFAPMNSRDRRIVHLALRAHGGVRSESEGEGRDRHIVVRSGNAPANPSPERGGGRREYRRL